MILIKSFLTWVLYDCFKLIYAYLNEADKVRECYNCLKIMMQANLHVRFFLQYCLLNAHQLNGSIYRRNCCTQTELKHKNNHEMSCDFPDSKYIIATLRIVKIENTELTYLLLLYFHDLRKTFVALHF